MKRHHEIFSPAIGVAILALALSGRAEFREHPDPNTLWCEDGKEIKVGPTTAGTHWNGNGLTLQPGQDGGIRLISPDNNHSGTVRGVALDPAYPYLVWEITATAPTPGYQAFSVGILDPKAVNFSLVGKVQPGIYSCRPFAAAPEPQRRSAYVNLTVFNNTLELRSLRLVRQPEQFLEISSPAFAAKGRLAPGDPLTFTLTLQEPADDVVVSYYKNEAFYFGHVVAIGGKLYCWLKPQAGSDRKVWTNTIPFKDCVNGAWTNQEEPLRFPPGAFLAEATVFRTGRPVQSFWTCSSYEFSAK